MSHIHEKVDFVVGVFVVHAGKVLLRKHDKVKKWIAVGGHIELDEDPNQAALRECKEEIGLDVELVGNPPDITEPGGKFKELITPSFMNIHTMHGTDTHQHIDMIYFARAHTADLYQNNIPEVERVPADNLRWFSESDLDDPQWDLLTTIRHYAKAALVAARD